MGGPSRAAPCAFAALAFLVGTLALDIAPSKAQLAPTLRLSTDFDGKPIRVFSLGQKRRIVDLSQSGDTARFSIGPHRIVVTRNGTVTVDGETRSAGPFTDIRITIDDNDSIDAAVTR